MLGYRLSASASASARGPTTGSGTFALYCGCSSGPRIHIYRLHNLHRKHSEEMLAERFIERELTQVELTEVVCLVGDVFKPEPVVS